MIDKDKMRDFAAMFEYVDGLIFWKVRPAEHFKLSRIQNRCNTIFAGKEAGNLNKGYK